MRMAHRIIAHVSREGVGAPGKVECTLRESERFFETFGSGEVRDERSWQGQMRNALNQMLLNLTHCCDLIPQGPEAEEQV